MPALSQLFGGKKFYTNPEIRIVSYRMFVYIYSMRKNQSAYVTQLMKKLPVQWGILIL